MTDGIGASGSQRDLWVYHTGRHALVREASSVFRRYRSLMIPINGAQSQELTETEFFKHSKLNKMIPGRRPNHANVEVANNE